MSMTPVQGYDSQGNVNPISSGQPGYVAPVLGQHFGIEGTLTSYLAPINTRGHLTPSGYDSAYGFEFLQSAGAAAYRPAHQDRTSGVWFDSETGVGIGPNLVENASGGRYRAGYQDEAGGWVSASSFWGPRVSNAGGTSQEFDRMVGQERERIRLEREPQRTADAQHSSQQRRWQALGGWGNQQVTGRRGTVLTGASPQTGRTLGSVPQTLGG